MDKAYLSIRPLVRFLKDKMYCVWKSSKCAHRQQHCPDTRLLCPFNLIIDGKLFLLFVGHLTTPFGSEDYT
jgi:hypothetical protein